MHSGLHTSSEKSCTYFGIFSGEGETLGRAGRDKFGIPHTHVLSVCCCTVLDWTVAPFTLVVCFTVLYFTLYTLFVYAIYSFRFYVGSRGYYSISVLVSIVHRNVRYFVFIIMVGVGNLPPKSTVPPLCGVRRCCVTLAVK